MWQCPSRLSRFPCYPSHTDTSDATLVASSGWMLKDCQQLNTTSSAAYWSNGLTWLQSTTVCSHTHWLNLLIMAFYILLMTLQLSGWKNWQREHSRNKNCDARLIFPAAGHRWPVPNCILLGEERHNSNNLSRVITLNRTGRRWTHNFLIISLALQPPHCRITQVDLGDCKKLSYLQRKCASNMAILYGADGISYETVRIGMDHECDRQTAYVCLATPSVESIQNAKFDTQQR